MTSLTYEETETVGTTGVSVEEDGRLEAIKTDVELVGTAEDSVE